MKRSDKLDNTYFCAYSGSSMHPILRTFDLLEIEACDVQALRVGDVICFLAPEETRLTVHRVIGISSGRICTRGDNNPAIDPYLLGHTAIQGRVVAAWHGQKRRQLFGGWKGLFWRDLTRRRYILKRNILFPLLSPLYHFFSCQSILSHFLENVFKPRIVLFQTNDCSHVRILFGRYVVGRYDAGHSRWHIKSPFHLFIHPKRLQDVSKIVPVELPETGL